MTQMMRLWSLRPGPPPLLTRRSCDAAAADAAELRPCGGRRRLAIAGVYVRHSRHHAAAAIASVPHDPLLMQCFGQRRWAAAYPRAISRALGARRRGAPQRRWRGIALCIGAIAGATFSACCGGRGAFCSRWASRHSARVKRCLRQRVRSRARSQIWLPPLNHAGSSVLGHGQYCACVDHAARSAVRVADDWLASAWRAAQFGQRSLQQDLPPVPGTPGSAPVGRR